jgi:hypothetical protein
MSLPHSGSGNLHDPGPPKFAGEALSRAGLSSAAFRPTAIGGTRAEAWATTVPGEETVALLRELRASGEPGWWPIIVGSDWDEANLARSAESCSMSPPQILDVAADLDPEAFFRKRWADFAESDEADAEDKPDIVGVWPDDGPAPDFLILPIDPLTMKYHPTVVAVVAASAGPEVPAALGWGDWNGCPPPEVHVAVIRRWAKLYGADLVGMSNIAIEMVVSRPPTTRDAAMALAWEVYGYCPYLVSRGTGSISALAQVLLGKHTWFFWWHSETTR